MVSKHLKTPLTQEILTNIMDCNGHVSIYCFKANKVEERFFARPICEYYNVQPKELSDVPQIFFNEVPINVSVGDTDKKLNWSPVEILKFINKMINASKTDKTIVVYADGLSWSEMEKLYGRRPPTPARKAKKTTVKRK